MPLRTVFGNLRIHFREPTTCQLQRTIKTSSVVASKDLMALRDRDVKDIEEIGYEVDRTPDNRKIMIDVKDDLTSFQGVPKEHLKRVVRIFIPARNTMQSATNNSHLWRIEFNTRERWENPLIGWASSGDPLSNMIVEFSSKDDAIRHVEKSGWEYFVEDEPPKSKLKPKSYGENFAWDKKSRVSTK